MKKILLAFDGGNYSPAICEFVKKLNDKKQVLAVGSFLPQVDYANLWSYAVGGLTGPAFIPLLEEQDSETIQENIKKFESFCVNNHIEFRVHRHFFDMALPELRKESRFADLLLLSSETFYSNIGTGDPNDYLKDALHGVECPVIVVPEEFEFPKRNILAYDGSESSVFAIKQFAYLFPELAKNPTTLVYVEKHGEEFPEQSGMEELVARHYSNRQMLKMDSNYKRFFSTWIDDKKDTILICGAFGRSGLSRLFRKSFVAKVIGNHRVPVFISHK